MHRPAFAFYPGDWTRNVKLSAASYEERGTWMQILCLMHFSSEYGVLRMSLKKIAKAAGARLSVVQALVEAKIMKGTEAGCAEPLVFIPRHARKFGEPVNLIADLNGPVWYSSRMVTDEYKRNVRAANSGDVFPDAITITKAITNGQVGCFTKGHTNGFTTPSPFQETANSNLSSRGVVTRLGEGEEGPW